jgi:glutaryl-CoA dehydrogenase
VGARRPEAWIGNGSIADVVVVWARDTEDGRSGFPVERDAGIRGVGHEGKVALRSVWNAQIQLTGYASATATGWQPPARSRTPARYPGTRNTVAGRRWVMRWRRTRRASYAKERMQFGGPLVSFH